MSTQLDNIKALIENMPAKDIPLAKKFIEDRNFEYLKELVDSAIIRVRKSLKSDNPKPEYIAIDLDELNKLQGVVDIYYLQINIDLIKNEGEEDDDD